MTAEQLAAYAGILVSLLFSYVPGLSNWYDPLEATYKRLIMLGSLVVVALGVYGLSCGNVYSLITCDKAGYLSLVNAFIMAAIANQAAYKLSPRKSD